MFLQQDVNINDSGGFVSLRVTVGFAQHARFDYLLFDSQGNNPQVIGSGSTLATAPPPMVINVLPSQLIGRFVAVDATVFAVGGGTNQPFSLIMDVLQDSTQVGQIVGQGNITGNSEPVVLAARLV